MTILELVQINLLSPMVLAFALGITATLLHSDLKLPDELYTTLSIYLLLAIGLKGGIALAETSLAVFWAPAVATLLLGIIIPVIAYGVARKIGKLNVADAAALAAHYGSVSAVTFAAAQTFLDTVGVRYEGFMPALVAILEVPAIVVALLIAQVAGAPQGGDWRKALRELLTSKSILLLVGGMIIGWLAGPRGGKEVAPVFVDLFKGALTFFLLELGMVAARRFRDLPSAGLFLLGFGIIMPIFNGLLGIWFGSMTGLSLGGSTILGVLAASASYIAAPAAVRIALPQANPGFYLTAALGITFPFNLAIGLPLYYTIASLIVGAH
ncbi:sodium-dependent bicarbonate transport family permease [Chloroflexus sp. MS-CIW-1]|uniref:sodium-dependent bicarbonate transport family permease n=1 Tax=Chloroflexus sp. MS-CIW-1 TaxID=3055768 RepID=UPI002647D495|nr:sodium-dependent bicarbonate transport family permease [Chloroflexus sp. MS-CIW-1]MDN5270783.1 sodium-dependent bicarbonate transport family permease [Chloroflexus sp. MS-CIW-1]